MRVPTRVPDQERTLNARTTPSVRRPFPWLALHDGVGLARPFAEGACVARCLVIAQYLQNKRGETRSPTTLSIRDDCDLRCDPLGI